ncbi:MAG: hypothetical protein V4858_03835 [Pseudomonadota bacterium]
MTDNQLPTARNEDRHSHIGIRLQYRVDEKWEHLEALGWSEAGFNFYHAQAIHEPVLQLRRSLIRFEGSIVWHAPNTSDEIVLATLVHELIYQRAKEVSGNTALHARLIRLIRVSGMVDEKRKILASLGPTPTDAQMHSMVAQRKLERPMFHYGVKVESEAWSAVVKSAWSVSSVLVSMDKWSEGLAKK